MKYEDSLYDLIKSLSPAEKRYFKSFIGGNEKKSGNKYLELFHMVAQQSSYNEQKLIKKLGYQEHPNRFAVAKNYLYHLILKSLRNFSKNDSINKEFNNIINDIELLASRRLYRNALRLIQKASKLAYEYQRQEMIFTVEKWKWELAKSTNEPPQYLKVMGDYSENMSICVAHIQEEFLFHQYWRELWLFNMQGLDIDQHPNILEKEQLPEFHSKLEDKSFLSKVLYYAYYYEYYFATKDMNKQIEICRDRVELFDETSQMKTIYIDQHLYAVKDYLKVLLDAYNLDLFLQKISILTSLEIPSWNLHLIARKEEEVMVLMCTFYLYSGQFDQLIEKLLPQVEEKLQREDIMFNKRSELWLLACIVFAFFGKREFSKALHYQNILISYLERNIFKDYLIEFKVLGLFIHFELGNFRLIKSKVRSLKRYLEIMNKSDAIVELLLKFFGTFNETNTDDDLIRNSVIKLKKDLEQIEIAALIKSDVNYVGVESWITYRLEGTLIHDSLKNIQEDNIIYTNPDFSFES